MKGILKRYFKELSFTGYMLIFYILFIAFDFTLKQLFPSLDLSLSITNRTINSLIQLSLIPLFIYKVITEKLELKVNIFFKLIIILLLTSFLINLFLHQSDIYNLLNIEAHNSYYIKYIHNLITVYIISHEFISNKNVKNICINALIITSLFIGIEFILTQFNIQNIGVRSGVLNDFGEVDAQYGRFTFLNWNENELSFFFSISFSLIVSRLMDNTRKSLLYLTTSFIAVLIIINAIILTGTRMGILVILTSTTFIFAELVFKKMLSRKLLLSIFFLVSITISRIIFHDNVLKTRIIVNSNALQLGGRLENWLYTFQLGSEDPIKGIGILNYFANRSSLPENLFLELFVTCGLVGLFLLVLILSKFIKDNLNYYKKNKKIESILISICLFSAISSLNIISIKVFWLSLAICISNIYITNYSNFNFFNEDRSYLSSKDKP